MARGSVRKRSFVKAGKRSINGLLLGYARVSKGDDQTNIMQARALHTNGCRRIFEEAASGGRWDRAPPALPPARAPHGALGRTHLHCPRSGWKPDPLRGTR